MRNVVLHHGLKLGDEVIKSVVIREDTVGDEDAGLERGLEGIRLGRFVEKRRVCAIGTMDSPALKDPTPEVLANLKRVDWDLIITAMVALDLEIAKAAGLVTDEKSGGRDQPG